MNSIYHITRGHNGNYFHLSGRGNVLLKKPKLGKGYVPLLLDTNREEKNMYGNGINVNVEKPPSINVISHKKKDIDKAIESLKELRMSGESKRKNISFTI